MANNTQSLVECDPEVGKSYIAEFAGNVYMVKVVRIFEVGMFPPKAKICECIDLTSKSIVMLLATHLNHAIFYRGGGAVS